MHTYRHTYIHTYIHTDRQIDRQTDISTESNEFVYVQCYYVCAWSNEFVARRTHIHIHTYVDT